MSDFYLMTRAAYAKLSGPVARGALRLGLTPDGITILGTAGTIIGGSKVIPQLLRDTRQLLATEWDRQP